MVPVVDDSEIMTYLQADLRPEVMHFPDYLLMEGYELNQHGMIPGTRLIGVEMKTEFPLRAVRSAFNDIFRAYGWRTDGVEIGGLSFRLLAHLDDAFLEIRAVQGLNETQVFVLYTPPKQVN